MRPAGVRALPALAARVRADAVVSSPEPKALEAAAALGPFAADPRLREHDRAGVPCFPDRARFVAAVEAGFARPDQVALGVESFAAALERFTAAVEAACAEHPAGRVAIVSHERPFRAAPADDRLGIARNPRSRPAERAHSLAPAR